MINNRTKPFRDNKKSHNSTLIFLKSIFTIICISILFTTQALAADVITNGTFDSGYTGWTDGSSGSGTIGIDNSNYGVGAGSVRGQTETNRNRSYTLLLTQSVGTINSADDVYLSLYWYKASVSSQASTSNMVVTIFKPSGDSTDIWSDATRPSAGSSSSGNVNASDVSSFFDQNGTYTIRLMASLTTPNDKFAMVQANFDDVVLDVQAAVVNQAPVVTNIPNQSISEGNSFTTIILDDYVLDVDNSDAEMVWTFSGNTELIVDITSRVATITTPSPTWTGNESITFRATDPGSLWSEDASSFTVTPTNDPPVVTNIPNQTIPEGATFTTISLDNYVSDPDNSDAEMTWSYSGNTELTVDITNRIATITIPDTDWNGAETITFRATDPGSLWSEDGVTFTVNAQNDAPILISSTTAVSVTPVNRLGTNSTVISATFTDVDRPSVSSFNITFKIQTPEVILVNNLIHGNGGLTVIDNGDNTYTANYTYNPADAQTTGFYNLYFEVFDGNSSAIDGYIANSNELEINEVVANNPPTITSGATTVSVSPVNRLSTNSTTISTSFSDSDAPGVNAFYVTFKIREPNNSTELTLVNNQTNGAGGLTITDQGGGNYTALYTYNPDDAQTLGLYDLYFYISDGSDNVTDDYTANIDELLINEPSAGGNVVNNGSFDSDITTNWTNLSSGSDGATVWDNSIYGNASGSMQGTASGRNKSFLSVLSQDVGNINSSDDVLLSLYWYKSSTQVNATKSDMIIRIIKPSGDSATIWSNTTIPSVGSPLSGTVTDSDVASFFDQDGTYTIRLVVDLTDGNHNSAASQGNFDDIVLDISAGVVNLPPVVTDIPNQSIAEGSSFTTINLDDYVSDPDNIDTEMNWTYSGNTELTIDITSRIATITTPNGDWNGSEVITFRVTDPGTLWDEDAATFTVNAQNDPPVVTNIPNQSIPESNSFTTITLDDYVSDVDNSDSEMAWTYSGNTELTVSIDINRIATITIPSLEWIGAETITFRATDPGTLWSADVATFTVTEQNDPPIVSNIPNQTIAEGASFTTITLDDYVADSDNIDSEMTWTYSGNTELLVNITNRIATITTPNTDWNGAETITFRATDPGTLWNEDPATFTVTAQNDSPTNINSTTAVSVSPINRYYTETTVISATFADIDEPAVSTFLITFKIREPNDITELILVNNLTHGNGGLTVVDNGSGSYTASYTYDPIITQTLGLYDLYFEVSDGTASTTDGYSYNAHELDLFELIINNEPTFVASATTVSPTSIDRLGTNSTTFSADFSDADQPPISELYVKFIALAPFGQGSFIIADSLQNGQGGLTIIDNGSGNYSTQILWDPPESQQLGYYDIYCATFDGTIWGIDGFENNLSELLITNGGENIPPIIMANATFATPAGVERIGVNPTTISATFTDGDIPPISEFIVTVKLRKPDNSTEIILADNATNGTQGLIINNQGGGIYDASISWDPADIETLGFYDIYFMVKDIADSTIDRFVNNDDELEIYDAISNNAPTIVSGNTFVLPNSLTRIGSDFTMIKSTFTDSDMPGKGAFTVTIKVRDASLTEYTIVDSAKHSEQGLRVTDVNGGNYEASVLWEPPEAQTIGTYDLYFYVEDNFAESTVDDYANNLDELTLTSTAIIGDGYMLRRSSESANCGGPASACHNLLTHQGVDCRGCHTPHGAKNIYLIKDTISTPASGLKEVIFKTVGIGDPYNDPDPVAGDDNHGAMADDANNVQSEVCEVCHTTTDYYRNDDSHTKRAHHNAEPCKGCHTHAEGFPNLDPGGGESSGGQACTCHSGISGPMGSSTSSYHHQINSTDPDYTASAKSCLMCHVDHNIFLDSENPGIGQRGKNLRSSINITPTQGNSSVLSNSDYSSSGDGGICLSCHTSVQTKSYAHPDGTTTTTAIPKADFDAATSSHNYNAPITFTDDGSTFNGNCVKCHSDNTTKQYQSSTTQFSGHTSDYKKLLAPMGLSSPTSPLEENFCYQCHSTTSNPNGGAGMDYYNVKSMSTASVRVEDSFNKTYKHPISYSNRHDSYGEDAADLGDGATRHAECEDCHDVHKTLQGTHDGSSYLVSNALKGAWGIEPTSWPAAPTPTDNANVFVTPVTYTKVEPAQNEYQICLKCHSNYVTLPAGEPNIAEEINPNYPSTHGITIANQNSYCNSTTMNEPWGTSGRNYCSDCHRSDDPTGPEGPHGSNAEHLLVATMVSDDNVGTPLCLVCHKSSVYWDGSASASKFSQHPATKGAHQLPYGCLMCHMWDYSSSSGLGVTNQTEDINVGQIFVHGMNKKWVSNERTGAAGSGQPVDAFVNGYLCDMDYVASECWSEVCKTHAGQGY